MEMNSAATGSTQIAVQIRNRQQAQINKLQIPQAGLTIGRGWGCDVILTDSAAEAVHAKVYQNGEGGWTLEDAGSANGTALNGTKLEPGQGAIQVASGDTITIGRTRITLYEPSHPVAAARSPSAFDSARDLLSNPGWALLITLFSLGTAILLHYLEQTGEYKPDQAVTQLLALLSVGLMFTLFWAVVGKLVRGEANLLANWSLGMLSTAALALSTDLTEWISFNLQSLAAHTWLQAGAAFLILFATLLFALAFTTNLSRASRIFIALLPPFIALSVETIMPMLEEDKPVNWPPAMLISRPPALQLTSPTTVAEYLQESQDLFTRTQDQAAQAAEK